MPLALSRDPGPTPSVGHVTEDMKWRESNETLLDNWYRVRVGVRVRARAREYTLSSFFFSLSFFFL